MQTTSDLPGRTDFQTLAAQATGLLRERILGQTWSDHLPSERRLATSLQVSRKTVRKVLTQLRYEGLVQLRSKRNVITCPPGVRARSEAMRVGLLLAEPLERMRPFTMLWVNRLMTLLQAGGHPLEIFHGRRYFSANGEKSLERLIAENPDACWVITTANRPLQEWFQNAGVRVVVAGSNHPGICLPNVDVDNRAVLRHAAALLLRKGHRRVALLLGNGEFAGNAESEEGFHEGMRALEDGDAVKQVYRVGSRPQEIVSALRIALNSSRPVSAVLLASPFSYLTALSYLCSIGRRAPTDVSLLSCQDEPFFDHLFPAPAYYACSPIQFAASMNRVIKQVIDGSADRNLTVRIMPDFIDGQSVCERPRTSG